MREAPKTNRSWGHVASHTASAKLSLATLCRSTFISWVAKALRVAGSFDVNASISGAAGVI
jgi:hypothetical protein